MLSVNLYYFQAGENAFQDVYVLGSTYILSAGSWLWGHILASDGGLGWRGKGGGYFSLPKGEPNDAGQEEAHGVVLCGPPVGYHEAPEVDGVLRLHRLGKH